MVYLHVQHNTLQMRRCWIGFGAFTVRFQKEYTHPNALVWIIVDT